MNGVTQRNVSIQTPGAQLEGEVWLPAGALGVVLFAHGSGSSRFSRRNQYVAGELVKAGLGTLVLSGSHAGLATLDMQWGTSDDILQPYNDAWDCMQLGDHRPATRIYLNFAKAIAAYEYTLVSNNSVFDAWADAGFPQVGTMPSRRSRFRLAR